MKEIITYPLDGADRQPVINIAGRDYAVMPYTTRHAVSTERVESAAAHGQDGLQQELSHAVRRMEQDIMAILLSAVPFTITEAPSDDGRIRYFSIMAPLLLPTDTREKWGDASDENLRRIAKEYMQHRQTGLPYAHKLVGWEVEPPAQPIVNFTPPDEDCGEMELAHLEAVVKKYADRLREDVNGEHTLELARDIHADWMDGYGIAYSDFRTAVQILRNRSAITVSFQAIFAH